MKPSFGTNRKERIQGCQVFEERIKFKKGDGRGGKGLRRQDFLVFSCPMLGTGFGFAANLDKVAESEVEQLSTVA